LAGRVYL